MKNVRDDLTGKKINHLTVIKREEDHVTISGNVKDMWLVQCDCGSPPRIVSGGDLRSGHTKSCGCIKLRQSNLMKTKIDISNQRFGRLKIIKRADYDYIYSNGKHDMVWIADCYCGNNNVHVRYSHLMSGNTRSCGCLLKEAQSNNGKLRKLYNNYDLSGEYGIGYTTNGDVFWFDLEDYDKIKNFCWYYSCGYLRTNLYDETNKKQYSIKFHEFIMDFPKEFNVDHIIHPSNQANKFDNRKSNLRLVDDSENQMNKSIQRNNTTGVVGVYFNKRKNMWNAKISYRKKVIDLGMFKTIEEATVARKQAEDKYFGEYSYVNSGNTY